MTRAGDGHKPYSDSFHYPIVHFPHECWPLLLPFHSMPPHAPRPRCTAPLSPLQVSPALSVLDRPIKRQTHKTGASSRGSESATAPDDEVTPRVRIIQPNSPESIWVPVYQYPQRFRRDPNLPFSHEYHAPTPTPTPRQNWMRLRCHPKIVAPRTLHRYSSFKPSQEES